MNVFDDAPGSGFYVSFDRALIDEAFVIKEISTSYWGSWRSPIVILRSIDRSLCAGVYERSIPSEEDFPTKRDKMVGFARVVSDFCTFAWICDVIITKEYRGRGLGKFLMASLMKHPEIEPRACLLATQDAHDLYRKFGFESITAMKRLPSKRGE